MNNINNNSTIHQSPIIDNQIPETPAIQTPTFMENNREIKQGSPEKPLSFSASIIPTPLQNSKPSESKPQPSPPIHPIEVASNDMVNMHPGHTPIPHTENTADSKISKPHLPLEEHSVEPFTAIEVKEEIGSKVGIASEVNPRVVKAVQGIAIGVVTPLLTTPFDTLQMQRASAPSNGPVPRWERICFPITGTY